MEWHRLDTIKYFSSKIFIAAVAVILLCIQSCAPSANMRKYEGYRFIQNNTASIPAGKVKVTYLGVSTLLIDDGETQLLMDGFVTRPSLGKVAFGRIQSDTLKIKEVIQQLGINRLKAVFTAHSHYDHALDAPQFSLLSNATLFGSLSTLNIGRGIGLSEQQMQQYQPGKPLPFGKFTVTILNSKHTPPFTFMGKSNDDLGIEIKKPLRQPSKTEEFTEGGAYDVLVQYGNHSLLIKASTNFIPSAFDSLHVDVLFQGTASLGKQGTGFRDSLYSETVQKLKPALFVPIHWDNFFKPLNTKLKALPKLAGNLKEDLNYLIKRTKEDNIQFHLMQGYDSVILF
ncbi:MAG: hypothetical protein U0V74_09275 [Chitinophagales bacterium]